MSKTRPILKLPNKKKNSNTRFSEFIRNASSSEKKHVYEKVMDKANKDQNDRISQERLESK